MANYTPPDQVHSPKSRWSLIKVLEDLGENATSIAVGHWDKEPVLAIRWNGTEPNPIGNPQSRGLPVWFVLPGGPKTQAVLSTLPDSMQALARNFLPE